jgi:hypothetical protein
VAGVKVVGEDTGEVIDPGPALLRLLCHFVDSFLFYVGWLFPLWDPKRPTLADKIMRTVVVSVR